MKQHVTEYLAAYFDGELHGSRRQKVEEHLESCSICQLELKELQGLSTLLKDYPPMIVQTSHDQFAAQVRLRLPRATPVQTGFAWQRVVDIGWLATPISIILGWALMQTTLLIINGIQGLGIDFSWMSWFSSLAQWINESIFWGLTNPVLWDRLRNAIPWLDLGEILVRTFAPSLVTTVLTAIFLSCWMACWWVFHQRQQQQIHRPFTPEYR